MSCPSESSAELLQKYLDSQYEQAGEIVEEEENQISIAKNYDLLSDPVALILEQVLEEKPLGFVLQDFQKLLSSCNWFPKERSFDQSHRDQKNDCCIFSHSRKAFQLGRYLFCQ